MAGATRAGATEADDAYTAADAAWQKGDSAAALDAFRGFLNKWNKDERAAVAAYRIGQCLGKLGKSAEAAEAFALCCTQYRESPWADGALFNEGRYNYDAERWQPAAAAFFDYTKLGKDASLRAQAWYWRGDALFHLDRPEDALAAYDSFFASPAEALATDECKELKPYARFGIGVCHQKAQRWLPAVAAFRQLFTDYPAAPMIDEALFNGADALRHLQRLDEAATWLTRVADEYPKSEYAPQALARLAALETERGNKPAAQAAIDRLAKDYPDSALVADGRFRLARQRLQAKDYAEAEKLYKAALDGATPEQEPIGLTGLGEARFGQSKWAEAAAAYELLLQKYPNHAGAPYARERLVEIYLNDKQFDRAEAAGRDYLKLYPTGADAAVVRYNVALAVFNQGRKDEAMKLFEEVVGADPKAESAAPVLLEMGRFALDKQRWPDARRAYELYLKYHAAAVGAVTARVGLAKVAEGEGSDAAAIVAYRAVADTPGTDPLIADALTKLTELYRKVGAEEKAQLAGQELRKRFPGSAQGAQALLSAGYDHFNAKRYNEAIFAFEAFLRDYPNDPQVPAALANLAASYYNAATPADHFRRAADTYRRLAKDFPTAEGADEALFWAGRASEQASDADGAAKDYHAFLDAHKDHALAPKARAALAMLLDKAGKVGDAIRVRQDAVAAATDPAVRAQARYELGRALYAAGQKDAAYEEFDKAVKDAPNSDAAALASFRLCGQPLDAEHYGDAVAAYTAWLKAHPTHAWYGQALYYLAWANEAGKEFAAAAQAFADAAKRLDDDDLKQSAVYHRGYNLVRAGQSADALVAFDEYDRNWPLGKERADVLFYRGQAYTSLRKWADAERVFRGLAKEFPDNELVPAARFNLGVSLQNQTKYLLAAEAYETITEPPAAGKPAPPPALRAQALLHRGECLYSAARYDDAIVALLAAEATADPKVLPDTRYWLGRSYQFKNDPVKAKERFNQVIKEYPGTEAAAKAKQALGEIGG
jgi:TolA-binding protein